MGSSSYIYPSLLFTLFCTISFPCSVLSGPISYNSINPNFTASYLQFIDNSGVFLASKNNSFQARITNAKPESESYYVVVTHVSSNTIIWSANRNTPISKSSKLRFTNTGLVLYNDTEHPIWSTPQNLSTLSSLQLHESGNLVLIDSENNTVWESFDFPIDVMVVGQKLKIGKSLVSSLSDEDLSEGGYKLVVGNDDAMLQWNEMNYWKLSMERNSYINTNFPVEYMVMNSTGVYLLGQNGEQVVIRITLHNSNDLLANSSDFRIMKIDHNGVLSVVKIGASDGSSNQEFKGPIDNCRIPFICKKLGVCTNGGLCQCASSFRVDQKSNNGDCVPVDSSLALSGSCNETSLLSNATKIKYLNLRNDLDYFSNEFTEPLTRDVNISVCENMCSMNCSCLGIFYSQNSGSCYMIRNSLGSMFIKSSSQRDANRLGFVKMLIVGNTNGDDPNYKNTDFPILALVLLPLSGVVLIAVVAILIYLGKKRRNKKWGKSTKSKLGHDSKFSSFSDEEIEFVSIPGLPVRFAYEELEAATEFFKNQIGSGGFGIVYKGTLKDGTDIAVKKITCLGSQGKKEFLTEIAVIGKIHHINLVRLKGFCAHKGQRYLVYEYMNRGSLERTLFRGDSVLEWKERYEIALGTARGLAYLHTGCEHKIIHCDVKPENILLHDRSHVKMSDFGLSKLLSPEESGLFTTLRGTRGYLAPEWLMSSMISDKIDVYSYGMVLLEIIRGKKNSSTSPSPQSQSDISGSNSLSSSGESEQNRLVYFPLLALEMHEERRYLDLVDPRLMGQVRFEDAEKLVRVALCCVHEDPSLRPSMSNVVGMLEGGMPLCEPRIESLQFLRFYGRRFTEESTLGQNNEQQNHELVMYRQQQQTSMNTSEYNSFSYLSSQQVSGPR
ncbi:hypothetical protein ACJIZ3_014367 [Penstemon smallii]|uniref:Receptor-like serine/threonine-protein kinase n=1 Tax=Penstemon smallii TaxID=265156 RepID=A0ABD3RJB7_9LAMI